jgi:hypothetical protein
VVSLSESDTLSGLKSSATGLQPLEASQPDVICSAARSSAGADVVLFVTHFWDDACTRQIGKLRRELGQNYDIRVTGYIPHGTPTPVVPDGVSAHFYSQHELAGVIPEHEGSERWHQFILLRFCVDFPAYEHYWMVEYDVRYTGDWGTLLATLDDPDVAYYGTEIQCRANHPRWYHWNSLCTGSAQVASAHFVKSFTPLQRLSRAAIDVIRAALRDGWSGHYEALWPTAIAHAGLRLEDIGGQGEFTPASRLGQHYTCTLHDPNGSPGSFVFRPTFEEHQISQWPPTLWHPVKPAGMQERRMPVPGRLAKLISLARRIFPRPANGRTSRYRGSSS